MEHVDVNGIRLAYRRQGSGPPLILLHGGLSDSREWRRQLDSLSDEFTVVAWDAPGCGRSSDPPASFLLPDYADCLAAFIAGLELERPHVLGLSFGGGLALELYRRHPTVPRTLILASAYAGWAGSLPADEVAERLEGVLRGLELPRDELVRSLLPTLFAGDAPPERIEELRTILSDFHPAGVRAMAHAFAEADLREVLPTIAVPTLLLYGDADERSPLTVARDLHDRIPGAVLVVLPGAGHQGNVEAPDAFNAEVRAFLRAQPA